MSHFFIFTSELEKVQKKSVRTIYDLNGKSTIEDYIRNARLLLKNDLCVTSNPGTERCG